MKRLQYVFVEVLCTSAKYTPLTYVDIKEAKPYIERQPWFYSDLELPILGMTDDLAHFIHKYCRCKYCKKQVTQNLERCGCGKQKDKLIHVEFPTKIFYSIFYEVSSRENAIDYSQRKAFRRKKRLSSAGGQYSKSDIKGLFSIQKGLCYYCGTSLISADGKNIFHIDHYVSVSNGGTNDLSNLVLACPSCNIKKGNANGDCFVRNIATSLSEENRLAANKTRRQVSRYKARLVKYKA
jgi:5-methylcytosine-specific restriction endonuclease McrA